MLDLVFFFSLSKKKSRENEERKGKKIKEKKRRVVLRTVPKSRRYATIYVADLNKDPSDPVSNRDVQGDMMDLFQTYKRKREEKERKGKQRRAG